MHNRETKKNKGTERVVSVSGETESERKHDDDQKLWDQI